MNIITEFTLTCCFEICLLVGIILFIIYQKAKEYKELARQLRKFLEELK